MSIINSVVRPQEFMLRLEGKDIVEVSSIQVSAVINGNITFDVTLPGVPGIHGLMVNTVGEIYFKDYTIPGFYIINIPGRAEGASVSDVLNVKNNEKQGSKITYKEYLAQIKYIQNKDQDLLSTLLKQPIIDPYAYFISHQPWYLLAIGELATFSTNRTGSGGISANLQFNGVLQNLDKAYKYLDTGNANNLLNKRVQGDTFGITGDIGGQNKNKEPTTSEAYQAYEEAVRFDTELSNASGELSGMYTINATDLTISKSLTVSLKDIGHHLRNLDSRPIIIAAREDKLKIGKDYSSGNAVSISVTKASTNSRSAVLTKLYTMLDSDKFKKRFITYKYDDDTKVLAILYNGVAAKAQKNLSPKVKEATRSENKHNEEALPDKTKDMSFSNITRLTGRNGFIHNMLNMSNPSLRGFWINLVAFVKTSNPYYNLFELRFPTLKFFNFIDNTMLYKKLSTVFFINRLSKNFDAMGGVTSMSEIMHMILNYLNLTILPQPAPTVRKNSDGTIVGINNYLLAPEMDFCSPPTNNFIFETDIISSNNHRDLSNEITRVTTTLKNLASQDINQINAFANLQFYAPNDSVGKSTKGTINTPLYSNEEILKGIMPLNIPMGDIEIGLADAAFGKSNKKEDLEKRQEARTKALTEDTKTANVAGAAKFARDFVDYKFPIEKYKGRNVSLNIAFNPYLTMGMPSLVIDTTGAYIGKVNSINHSLAAEGDASTTVRLVNVRYFDDPVVELVPTGYTSFLDKSLQDENIKDIYKSIIGDDATDGLSYILASNDPDMKAALEASGGSPIPQETKLQILVNKLYRDISARDTFETHKYTQTFRQNTFLTKDDFDLLFNTTDVITNEQFTALAPNGPAGSDTHSLNKAMNDTDTKSRMSSLKDIILDSTKKGKIYFQTRQTAPTKLQNNLNKGVSYAYKS
jgi:hypothetical protein